MSSIENNTPEVIVLDLFGSLAIGGGIAALVAALVIAVPIRTTARLALALAIGAWIGLVCNVAAENRIANLAVLLTLFALPLAVTALLVAFVPQVRAALLGIPAKYLVGVNAIRVLGVFFLLLAAAGRLGGPFPWFAGIGDIATAIAAIPLARAVAGSSLRNPRAIAWNVFGALDLIVAVTLGIASRNGSPIQLIHAGAGSDAITALPWALVPLVLVPLFLIDHATIFARQLGARHALEGATIGEREGAPAFSN